MQSEIQEFKDTAIAEWGETAYCPGCGSELNPELEQSMGWGCPEHEWVGPCAVTGIKDAESIVKAKWQRWFESATPSDQPIHFQHFIADKFGWKWTTRCPICRTSMTKFDFHHWDYDRDIGVRICRECHSAIHGGTPAQIQSDRSPTGLWLDQAFANTVELLYKYGESPSRKASRLNIPGGHTVLMESWGIVKRLERTGPIDLRTASGMVQVGSLSTGSDERP